jgi:hypothetical protein
MSYERALYLKCLNNELIIPPSIIPILEDKGLLSEGNERRRFFSHLFPNDLDELVNDLINGTNIDESNLSRRPSRTSNAVDEVKTVKFASPSSLTKSSSQNKMNSTVVAVLTGVQAEEVNTISTIRTLLQ